jgi:endo-1,4-beta-xylanase
VAERDKAIAETGEKFLNTVLQVPAVKAVITWQLSDHYSFYKGIALQKDPTTQRLPRPLPYDANMQKKPLWFAMARAFENAKRS